MYADAGSGPYAIGRVLFRATPLGAISLLLVCLPVATLLAVILLGPPLLPTLLMSFVELLGALGIEQAFSCKQFCRAEALDVLQIWPILLSPILFVLDFAAAARYRTRKEYAADPRGMNLAPLTLLCCGFYVVVAAIFLQMAGSLELRDRNLQRTSDTFQSFASVFRWYCLTGLSFLASACFWHLAVQFGRGGARNILSVATLGIVSFLSIGLIFWLASGDIGGTKVCRWGKCFRDDPAEMEVRLSGGHRPYVRITFRTDVRFISREISRFAKPEWPWSTSPLLSRPSSRDFSVYFVAPGFVSWAAYSRADFQRSNELTPASINMGTAFWSIELARHQEELKEFEALNPERDTLTLDVAVEGSPQKNHRLVKFKGRVFFCPYPHTGSSCETVFGSCGDVEYRLLLRQDHIANWPGILENARKRVLRGIDCETRA